MESYCWPILSTLELPSLSRSPGWKTHRHAMSTDDRLHLLQLQGLLLHHTDGSRRCRLQVHVGRCRQWWLLRRCSRLQRLRAEGVHRGWQHWVSGARTTPWWWQANAVLHCCRWCLRPENLADETVLKAPDEWHRENLQLPTIQGSQNRGECFRNSGSPVAMPPDNLAAETRDRHLHSHGLCLPAQPHEDPVSHSTELWGGPRKKITS